MAQFKSIRPSNELRLRKWPPGRLSQLKIVVANLEQAINSGLAAQVVQNSKRRFSEFVPIIPFQDITGEVEFREIRVFFEPPKGLKNLLFYEYNISTNSGFFSFTEHNSPNPSFVFSGLEDNTTYYIRIRVVTSDGLVGPFSDTLSGTTPTAKAFGTLDKDETPNTVSSSSFSTIFSKDVDTIGGKVYYSLQYSIELSSTPALNTFNYSTVELRFLENEAQVGQNFLVTNYGYGGAASPGFGDILSIFDGEQATAGNPLTTTQEFVTRKRGTFIQKFHNVDAGTVSIELQARIVNYHTLPNEFEFNAGASVGSFAAASSVSVKNFTSFEVFTQA